jgi:hypothetical protein
MKKPKKSVEEKIRKEMPDFVEAVVGLSVDELNTRVLNLAKELEAIDAAKEQDLELERAQELVNEYSGPYREGKRVAKLRIKYLISLIEEKGGAV